MMINEAIRRFDKATVNLSTYNPKHYDASVHESCEMSAPNEKM